MTSTDSQVRMGRKLSVVRSRKEIFDFFGTAWKAWREAWQHATVAEKAVLITGLIHMLPFDDAILIAAFPPLASVVLVDEAIALPVYLGTLLIVIGRYLMLPKESAESLGTNRTKR